MPGKTKITDVICCYLVKGTKALLVVGAAMGQPVAGFIVCVDYSLTIKILSDIDYPRRCVNGGLLLFNFRIVI